MLCACAYNIVCALVNEREEFGLEDVYNNILYRASVRPLLLLLFLHGLYVRLSSNDSGGAQTCSREKFFWKISTTSHRRPLQSAGLFCVCERNASILLKTIFRHCHLVLTLSRFPFFVGILL